MLSDYSVECTNWVDYKSVTLRQITFNIGLLVVVVLFIMKGDYSFIWFQWIDAW